MNPHGVMYWFRRDLRLDDNPGLRRAVALAKAHQTWLLPIALPPPQAVDTPWGAVPRGAHALAWSLQAHDALDAQLRSMGSLLWRCQDLPALHALAKQCGVAHIVGETIAAPFEQAQWASVASNPSWQAHGVHQSTLLAPEALPFAPEAVPLVFTAFRQAVEAAGLRATQPCEAVTALPPLPPELPPSPVLGLPKPVVRDDRSSIAAERRCGELGAREHWQRYLDRQLPLSYWDTRNHLNGPDFSSQLSLDLAWGTLSARRAVAMLDDFERDHGQTKSSYWLWFELMWRDHFRWLHQRFGRQLYRARGLAAQPRPVRASHKDWLRWCAGQTGQPLVDAGMRELTATGFLSNRMRQIVASYWLHDMGGDWRAGAAWFEAQLMDEDVFSNQGNWLYIAGLGSDPRGGRRFDIARQTAQHDRDGHYQRQWGTA